MTIVKDNFTEADIGQDVNRRDEVESGRPRSPDSAGYGRRGGACQWARKPTSRQHDPHSQRLGTSSQGNWPGKPTSSAGWLLLRACDSGLV